MEEHKNKSLKDVGQPSDSSHCFRGLCLQQLQRTVCTFTCTWNWLMTRRKERKKMWNSVIKIKLKNAIYMYHANYSNCLWLTCHVFLIRDTNKTINIKRLLVNKQANKQTMPPSSVESQWTLGIVKFNLVKLVRKQFSFKWEYEWSLY